MGSQVVLDGAERGVPRPAAPDEMRHDEAECVRKPGTGILWGTDAALDLASSVDAPRDHDVALRPPVNDALWSLHPHRLVAMADWVRPVIGSVETRTCNPLG